MQSKQIQKKVAFYFFGLCNFPNGKKSSNVKKTGFNMFLKKKQTSNQKKIKLRIKKKLKNRFLTLDEFLALGKLPRPKKNGFIFFFLHIKVFFSDRNYVKFVMGFSQVDQVGTLRTYCFIINNINNILISTFLMKLLTIFFL